MAPETPKHHTGLRARKRPVRQTAVLVIPSRHPGHATGSAAGHEFGVPPLTLGVPPRRVVAEVIGDYDARGDHDRQPISPSRLIHALGRP